jgi:hypothetical protein
MEFNDDDGGKYAITLDGNMSRTKIIRILELVDSLGSNEDIIETPKLSNDTSFGKLYQLIETNFPLGSFNSNDILELYENEYKEKVTLSTISTYLSRLEQKKLLVRQRTNSGWIYKRAKIDIIER